MFSKRKLEKLMSCIGRLIVSLSDKETKLRNVIKKMREEERYYLSLCKEALLRKEKLKMETYAYHITSLRWAIEIVRRIEAKMISLRIRLITCQHVIRIWMTIGPDIQKIGKDARPLYSLLPWLKTSLEDVYRDISTFLEATKWEGIDVPEEPPVSREIPAEILREVMEEVREMLEESLPSPPREPEPRPEAIEEEGPLFVSIEDAPSVKPMSVEEVANNLMDYIRRNGRRLNIRRCADELGVPEEDVRAALKWLCDKGMVKIRGLSYGVREGP